MSRSIQIFHCDIKMKEMIVKNIPTRLSDKISDNIKGNHTKYTHTY